MKRNAILLCAVAGAGVAAVWWLNRASDEATTATAMNETRSSSDGESAAARPAGVALGLAVAQGVAVAQVRPALSIPGAVSPAALEASAALGSGEAPNFEVDGKGNLVVNGQTRHELERLLSLNDRGAALALMQQLANTLPITAYREATDAFYAYQSYNMMLLQAFPPDQPVTDEAAAAAQFAVLKTLRVQQFGAETARAYFGEEEDTAQRLLADMQAHRVASNTLEERAEQAQQRLSPTGR